MPAKLNLINKRFTRLTALYELPSVRGQVQWYCQCDCGNFIIVSAARLQSGNVKSCGCLKREKAIEKQKSATAAVICNGTSKNIQSKIVHSNTGVKGVSYNRASKKFEAKLVFAGEVKFRQNYEFLEDAVAGRIAAEKKWFWPLLEKWNIEKN